ncbi:DUF397 domain-containing protein [Actinomadura sp. BRA 177]|uniref:DUF397 domain-containing protein n=1 Tax=Actinomadura sp. BRA 177 TaxID=2745202 RepID=UPI00159638B5|nr:DUF397 domain-containing protein [Actinomadura sp. BRA 177]NVI89943.1 DUF397 domain-containing protein [Actinomadura sp. BRA 177]
MSEIPPPVWRRSSRSTSGENCVEVAVLPTDIGVRDSKDPKGPRLAFPSATWRRFAQQVKTGDHDRP